jgi:hypothetical protein
MGLWFDCFFLLTQAIGWCRERQWRMNMLCSFLLPLWACGLRGVSHSCPLLRSDQSLTDTLISRRCVTASSKIDETLRSGFISTIQICKPFGSFLSILCWKNNFFLLPNGQGFVNVFLILGFPSKGVLDLHQQRSVSMGFWPAEEIFSLHQTGGYNCIS